MTVLITGGAASGKSALAENACRALAPGQCIYVATMAFDARDPECRARVEKHQKRREKLRFVTLERPVDLAGAPIPENSSVLLECVTNLLANELFSAAGSGENAAGAVMAGIQRLIRLCEHLVVVSGEVFSDGMEMEYDESTRKYIRMLGEINRRCAALSDTVLEAVCGIPVVRRGEPL